MLTDRAGGRCTGHLTKTRRAVMPSRLLSQRLTACFLLIFSTEDHGATIEFLVFADKFFSTPPTYLLFLTSLHRTILRLHWLPHCLLLYLILCAHFGIVVQHALALLVSLLVFSTLWHPLELSNQFGRLHSSLWLASSCCALSCTMLCGVCRRPLHSCDRRGYEAH